MFCLSIERLCFYKIGENDTVSHLGHQHKRLRISCYYFKVSIAEQVHSSKFSADSIVQGGCLPKSKKGAGMTGKVVWELVMMKGCQSDIQSHPQFRISPHRHNAILGIENQVQKGLFP